ncbi:MAG: hypothetical protein PHS93_10195 [Candidatus Omnitrophica bacterium]|nr:hypothetical protein [Candidatus Omnitrophota bacterium]MDD5353520.1 hypothetical protein [Candidatus Omnitrophota bacterium]
MLLEEQFTKETGLKLEIAPIPVNWCEFIDWLMETVDDKIILLDAAKQANELLTIKLTTKDALIEAQEEYIEFLSDYMDKTADFLRIHHNGCPDETIMKGEKLREKINKLKNE